jgi:hypothetical protein
MRVLLRKESMLLLEISELMLNAFALAQSSLLVILLHA